jgi:ABC-2 type transport system ATP-binding protein
MSQAIIEIRDVSLGFSRRRVLASLNLSLRAGEWAVIAGCNGAGKSTLLRAIAGVLLPDAGAINRSAAVPPAKIGFLSDRFSLFEDWTVGRAIDFHCRVFQVREFDDRLVKLLGVGPASRVRDLSAGERAILHLSLALAQKPALLLVDEVLHMLDPYIRDLFVESLIEAVSDHQAAVVTVNHTFSEIERLPDRVLVMANGRFTIDEAPEALRGLMKKIVSREPLPGGVPCFFSKTAGEYSEYFIYPFHEEMRAQHALDFQDIALPEIIKAFIGGGYEQKRMA